MASSKTTAENVFSNLVSAYESELNKPNKSYSRSVFDIIESERRIYEEYCAGKPVARQLFTWCQFLRNPIYAGIYEACKAGDMAALSRTLYHSARISVIKNHYPSGTDHGIYIWKLIPLVLAADSPELVSKLFPQKQGLSAYSGTNGNAAANLFLAIWYNDDNFGAIAREEAKRALSKKNTMLIGAFTRYLLAVLNKDADAASEELLLLCKGKKQDSNFGENSFTHSFCIQAHGLYNMLRYVYNGELYKKVSIPSESNFFFELAEWQERNRCSGELLYSYDGSLSILNSLLTMEMPECSLGSAGYDSKGERTIRKKFRACDFFKESLINQCLSLLTQRRELPNKIMAHTARLDSYDYCYGNFLDKERTILRYNKTGRYYTSVSVLADSADEARRFTEELFNKHDMKPTGIDYSASGYNKHWLITEAQYAFAERGEAAEKEAVLALARATNEFCL